MSKLTVTSKTKLKRGPQRAVFERSALYGILDESLMCHIGFQWVDPKEMGGKPKTFVIPTLTWRIDNSLYFHGSPGSRMLQAIGDGQEICLSTTLLDGIVLARSAYHHSMNYRSAVIFGRAQRLLEKDEKTMALKALTEQIAPGRWDVVRAPNDKELNGTDMLVIDLTEASVKMREGGPLDDEADLSRPVWAGQIPIKRCVGPLISDSGDSYPTPDYSAAYGERWIKKVEF